MDSAVKPRNDRIWGRVMTGNRDSGMTKLEVAGMTAKWFFLVELIKIKFLQNFFRFKEGA